MRTIRLPSNILIGLLYHQEFLINYIDPYFFFFIIIQLLLRICINFILNYTECLLSVLHLKFLYSFGIRFVDSLLTYRLGLLLFDHITFMERRCVSIKHIFGLDILIFYNRFRVVTLKERWLVIDLIG